MAIFCSDKKNRNRMKMEHRLHFCSFVHITAKLNRINNRSFIISIVNYFNYINTETT